MPNLPLMAEALWDLGVQIQFEVVGKTAIDFQTIEYTKNILDFVAVLQPIHPRKLLVKPEGERNWKWWDCWTTAELQLDWVVSDERKRIYRVMSKTDWVEAGYQQYELVEKPRNEPGSQSE